MNLVALLEAINEYLQKKKKIFPFKNCTIFVNGSHNFCVSKLYAIPFRCYFRSDAH